MASSINGCCHGYAPSQPGGWLAVRHGLPNKCLEGSVLVRARLSSKENGGEGQGVLPLVERPRVSALASPGCAVHVSKGGLTRESQWP